ncbi:MAG: hypothetical protein RI897_327 [Verrucomicrobiota bacterium]
MKQNSRHLPQYNTLNGSELDIQYTQSPTDRPLPENHYRTHAPPPFQLLKRTSPAPIQTPPLSQSPETTPRNCPAISPAMSSTHPTNATTLAP